MSLAKRLLEERSYNTKKWASRGNNLPFDIELTEEGITHRFSRALDSNAVQEFNSRIQNWGSRLNTALKSSIDDHNMHGAALKDSLKNNYSKQYGEIFRIGFSFLPEGVYVHKGVGRGYVAAGDTVVKTSKTVGWNRRPKLWFNPVVEAFIPELSDIISSYARSVVINVNRIYIK